MYTSCALKKYIYHGDCLHSTGKRKGDDYVPLIQFLGGWK
jgi:hypothetical protein